MHTICPNGHSMEVPADEIGHEVQCPTCQQTFAVGGRTSGGTATAERTAVGSATGRRTTATAPSHNGRTGWQNVLDRWNFDLLDDLRPVAQLLLLLGLVLALAARGWDTVGDRSVSASEAQATHAEAEWNDDWEDRFDRLASEEAAIRTHDDFTAADRQRLEEMRTERARLETERERDRTEHLAQWSDLERDARQSAAENRIAGPWREGLFVLGTILFSLGLLVIGFTSEGGVRWMCLVLLAIIVLSVYFGGAPWRGIS